MKAIDSPFTKIINGTCQFVIPVFQRDYSWTESQCEQLWNDIMHAASGPSEHGHFLGSVVYVATGDSSAGFTRWLLIDGQQRLTTLTLLLIALRDHIQATRWAGIEDGPTARRINAYFLANQQEEGDRRNKLRLRRRDQETLVALLAGKTPPLPVSERLRDNYDFFREQLADADPEAVYRGIGRLMVVDVTLDRVTDNPQLIFESLNSTGVDLSQSDLIRNFILMRLPEREQTRLYNEYWASIEMLFRESERAFDAFVRDFIALQTQASKQERSDEIYFAFRRYFGSLHLESTGLDGFLDRLRRFAKYYAAFSIKPDPSNPHREALARLRRLADVPAILVMSLCDCHGERGTMSASEFEEGVVLLESYIFRRAICGEQTRAYWNVFANLAYAIDPDHPLESLKVGLARQHDNYRFPSDAEFKDALEHRDLYGKRVCLDLLERLENHGSKEPSDVSHYSIEHIMPQNERLGPQWRQMLGDGWRETQKTWLHRLGNLTLTGYNSSYSDRPFEEKKSIRGGFSESSVRLNRFVREQKAWTAKEMEIRGRELAKRCLGIWPPLKVAKELIDRAEHQEMRRRAERRDVSKLPMTGEARRLFDLLRPLIHEIDTQIIEIAEKKSISYHGPEFFLEVLPRKHRLGLLLPLDFNEVDDPTGIARDATRWKFIVNAQYEGGVTLRIKEPSDVHAAIPIIRQAYSRAVV